MKKSRSIPEPLTDAKFELLEDHEIALALGGTGTFEPTPTKVASGDSILVHFDDTV
jgi:hypothetical protein